MRYRTWIAAVVGLAGLGAPAVGQPADPRSDRPDPTDFLLPPVSTASRSRPADDLPRRSATPLDDRGGDDLPNLRPAQSGSTRQRPIAPLPRDDSDSPPTVRPRRPAPAQRYDDDDAPRTRRPAPQRRDDDYDDPPPRPRRQAVPPSDERGDDEIPPPRPPRRQSAPPPRDDYDDPPPPRRKPAATFADPTGDIRPVSASQIEDSRSNGDEGRADRRSDVNIIDYLAGDRDRNVPPPPRPRNAGSGGQRAFDPASHTHEAALFGKKVSDVFEPLAPAGKDWFRSDHCFDSFVSPVTNPFLFEDPRSLTEIRPVFIYQRVPSSEPLFNGGDLYFVGLQGRLAITDRFSLVLHKFGGQGVNPSTAFDLSNFNSDNFGLAEVWLGPKYTFIRNMDDGRLLAGGLQFQIPIGSGKVYQNTGQLSIVPYATFAQNFFSTGYGSFNGLIGAGYALSTNSERSDYGYVSSHIDFDVANGHRFYPLAELNWYYYTTNGSSKPFQFEGRDLVNFGAQAKGSNLLTWALGGRVKITQHTEIGGAFEGPLVGNRELFRYRFTCDLIWRY